MSVYTESESVKLFKKKFVNDRDNTLKAVRRELDDSDPEQEQYIKKVTLYGYNSATSDPRKFPCMCRVTPVDIAYIASVLAEFKLKNGIMVDFASYDSIFELYEGLLSENWERYESESETLKANGQEEEYTPNTNVEIGEIIISTIEWAIYVGI